MSKSTTQLHQAAEEGAVAQTRLMASAFARDLANALDEFGLEAVCESIPSMVRGPAWVVEQVTDLVKQSQSLDECQQSVEAHLHKHLKELDWFSEQFDWALTAVVRFRTAR